MKRKRETESLFVKPLRFMFSIQFSPQRCKNWSVLGTNRATLCPFQKNLTFKSQPESLCCGQSVNTAMIKAFRPPWKCYVRWPPVAPLLTSLQWCRSAPQGVSVRRDISIGGVARSVFETSLQTTICLNIFSFSPAEAFLPQWKQKRRVDTQT